MAETASKQDLLETCFQDLSAARRLAAARLPLVIAAAGGELAPLLKSLRQDYADEAERFEKTGYDLDGPENLWMAGIMDDAERDTKTIAPGPLLDTALIGAARKAVAADEVSLETAVAVARSIGEDEAGELVEEMRGRARQNDARLQRLLHRIA